MLRPTDSDVLFVDVPVDFRFPESSWCLGYRYMIAALRQAGFGGRILHPPLAAKGESARQRLIAEIVAASERIVGFTTYDLQLGPLLDLIAGLRSAGLRSHITLGGLCASAVSGEILEKQPCVDSVVVGEGERAIVDLARAPARGVYQRPPLEDLSALPAPALEDFTSPGKSAPPRLINAAVPVIASRGCYGRCTFCCIHEFYRSLGTSWRGVPPAMVVDEIERSIAATGARRVTFVDENFMGPKLIGSTHAVGIAREIVRRGIAVEFNFGCRANDLDRSTLEELQRAGLAAVSVGVESMSAPTLRLFRKGTSPDVNYAALALLEELGVSTEITFIFFHPMLGLSEIRDNLRFVDYVNRSRHLYFNNRQPFTSFIPFFGTELTARMGTAGLTERRLDAYEVRYADPAVGFIESAVRSVPTERLMDLRNLLPEDYSPAVARLRRLLHDYYVNLNMQRIPELVAHLCDRFERGDSTGSDDVRAVMSEFDTERERIDRLAGDLLSHAVVA